MQSYKAARITHGKPRRAQLVTEVTNAGCRNNDVIDAVRGNGAKVGFYLGGC